jgi:hypothetical protein
MTLHNYYFPASDICLAVPPKNGSTRLLSLLVYNELLENGDFANIEALSNAWFRIHDSGFADKYAVDPNSFQFLSSTNFVFVYRNPYDRFFSSVIDKFILMRDPNYFRDLAKLQWTSLEIWKKIEIDQMIEQVLDSDYVKELVKNDLHFIPQCSFLSHNLNYLFLKTSQVEDMLNLSLKNIGQIKLLVSPSTRNSVKINRLIQMGVSSELKRKFASFVEYEYETDIRMSFHGRNNNLKPTIPWLRFAYSERAKKIIISNRSQLSLDIISNWKDS